MKNGEKELKIIEDPDEHKFEKIFCSSNKGQNVYSNLRSENDEKIISDVDGSYTGITIDGDYPIQDPDDL